MLYNLRLLQLEHKLLGNNPRVVTKYKGKSDTPKIVKQYVYAQGSLFLVGTNFSRTEDSGFSGYQF